jgi:hypothetical protein
MSLYWKLTNLNYTLLASLATCFSHFCSGCNVAFNDEQITIAPQSELTPQRTRKKAEASREEKKWKDAFFCSLDRPFFHYSTITKEFQKTIWTDIDITNNRYLFINVIIRQLSFQPLIKRWKTYQWNIQKNHWLMSPPTACRITGWLKWSRNGHICESFLSCRGRSQTTFTVEEVGRWPKNVHFLSTIIS